MPYLQTFKYEIFLSYGWAGNADPDQGARLWAGQLRDLINKYLSANLHAPRIYFDENDPRVGPVPERLYKALDDSALLVFAVSPASLEPTSWCQKEAAQFWDRARPLVSGVDVLAPEHRIFKVVQSVPSPGFGEEPSPLRDLDKFDLFEVVSSGSGEASRAGNPLQPKSERVQREIDKLCAALRGSLEQVRAYESFKKIGRVFIGPAYSRMNRERFCMLRRELLFTGHEVCSVTPLPVGAEEEEDHRFRLELAVEGARLAVHTIPEPIGKFCDWQRNHAAQQIRHCLQKSAAHTDFSVYLWEDPDQKAFDAQCREQITEAPGVLGNQDMKVGHFGALMENVKDCLMRPLNIEKNAGVRKNFDVVIDFNESDVHKAAEVRQCLELRGLEPQFSNPTRPIDNRYRREKKNGKQFYSRTLHFVIVFGQANDEWANDTCFAMSQYLEDQGKALVLVAPPPSITKPYYRAPDKRFIVKHCPMGDYQAPIDEWLAGQ